MRFLEQLRLNGIVYCSSCVLRIPLRASVSCVVFDLTFSDLLCKIFQNDTG